MIEKTSGTKSPITLRRVLPIAAVLFALAVLCVAPVGADETAVTPVAPVEIVATYDWYTGHTGEGPYVIDSIGDLAGLAKLTQGAVTDVTVAATNFAGATITLANDLTFGEGEYWYYKEGTIEYDYRIKDFAGIFDGENYKITGLKFKNTVTGNSHYFGLFHTIVAGGEVNNLILNTVTADLAANNYFGSLACQMNGKANNCQVTDVTVTNGGQIQRSGGLFGLINGSTITNCSAKNVTFNGSSFFYQVGGLAGSCSSSTLCGCTTEGIRIEGTNLQIVGGLIGILTSSTLQSCKVDTVTFSGTSSSCSEGGFGGLVGSIYSGTASITDCSVSFVTATITGETNKCGGFIGIIKVSTTLTNCDATTVTLTLGDSSTDQIKVTGGFIGQMYGGTNTITNCHLYNLDATVTGYYETAFAGFVTMQNSITTFKKCSASGTIDATGVTETDETGGFLGELGYGKTSETTLMDCTADVDIIANGPAGGFIAASWGYSAGGIAGTIKVTNCHAYGDVNSLSGAAGGFVGVGNRGTYEECTANGDVSGKTAAGFWGAITPNTATMADKTITIDKCETTSAVTGVNIASGFVGTLTASEENDSNGTTVTIQNCDTKSSVTGTNPDTVIVDFATETVLEGSTSHYTSTGNTIEHLLTLNANDGISAPITQFFNHGDTISLTNPFVRTGYTFIGWNETQDGTAVAYGEEEPLLFTKSLSLYALWKLDTTTVSITTDKDMIHLGDIVTLTASVPAHEAPGATYLYQWYSVIDNVALDGKTTATITVAPEKRTVYNCTVIVQDGTTQSEPISSNTLTIDVWKQENYISDDDAEKLEEALAGKFKELFSGKFIITTNITLFNEYGGADHQKIIKFMVECPPESGITATNYENYDFVVLHLDQSTVPATVEQVTNVNPTANGLEITSAVSPFVIGYSLIQTGESSTPQGSSVWLTEPLNPTPTEQPTDVVPTDIPTTQPTQNPQESTGLPLAGIVAGVVGILVVAGLGVVAVLRRK